MFRLLQRAALLAGLVYGNAAAGAAEKISLYSHYTTAPFAVEGGAAAVELHRASGGMVDCPVGGPLLV